MTMTRCTTLAESHAAALWRAEAALWNEWLMVDSLREDSLYRPLHGEAFDKATAAQLEADASR